MKSRNTKKYRLSKTKSKRVPYFTGPLGKAGGKKSMKKRSASKKGKKKNSIIDIGKSRPRITGEVGMSQRMDVSKQLAQKSMAQSRSLAQGLAQSLARGMGQSLA
jgi:hypothetical protein